MAVTSNGWALAFASDRLCADRALVLAAVGQSGRALECVRTPLFEDAAVRRAAVRADRLALLLLPRAERAPFRPAGVAETRFLLRKMPRGLPDEVVVAHILPHLRP